MYFNENRKDISTQNSAYFMHSIEKFIENCEQIYQSVISKQAFHGKDQVAF